MRKKIYFQNSFGDQGEKEFTSEGFKTTFGIFTKEFKERRITDSDLIKKQKDYVIIHLFYFVKKNYKLPNSKMKSFKNSINR